MEATATLETPDNAAPAPATEEFAPAESAEELAATDSVGEAEQTDPETPTDDAPDPLEALEADALEQHPKIKALLDGVEARTRESERQRAIDAERKRVADTQAEAYQRSLRDADTEGLNRLNAEIMKVAQAALDAGAEKLDPQAVGQAVIAHHRAATAQAFYNVAQADGQLIQHYFPDYQVPAELNEAYGQAQARRDPRVLAQVRAAMLIDAAGKAAYARARAEVEAEAAKKAEAAAETERLQKESKARKAQPSPTRVEGTAPGTSNPDAVLNNPNATDKERRAAFKAKHGFDMD